MADKRKENNLDELDCEVTVHDGAYMTCDMVPEASEETQKDHDTETAEHCD